MKIVPDTVTVTVTVHKQISLSTVLTCFKEGISRGKYILKVYLKEYCDAERLHGLGSQSSHYSLEMFSALTLCASVPGMPDPEGNAHNSLIVLS